MNGLAMLLYASAGLIVLAEAVNKLHRIRPLSVWLPPRERLTEILKTGAWVLLALGGAGAIATPLFKLPHPTPQGLCIVIGFAILIVRTRIKEG